MHRHSDTLHNGNQQREPKRNTPLLSISLAEKVDRSYCDCLWPDSRDPHRIYGSLLGYANQLPLSVNKLLPPLCTPSSNLSDEKADGLEDLLLLKKRKIGGLKMEKVNIKHIGILFFIVASCFCIYQISVLENEKPLNRRYTRTLKLVNIFSRHGDRAPSDGMPPGDPHKDNPLLFWPNGMSNLTETGKHRMTRVGMELRRKYYQHIDYEPSHFLALSSPIYRCQESLQLILKGIFDIDQPAEKGRQIFDKNLRKTCNSTLSPNNKDCLPIGPGYPEDWKKIPIDINLVPSLTYEFLNNCSYRKKNPSPLDEDLMKDPTIRSMNGVLQLQENLRLRYNQSLNFFSLGLFSTILSEMNIVRTQATINYTDHYAAWVNQVVPKTKRTPELALFDVYEHMAVIGYQNRIRDESNYIQTGPMITSLIESSMVALNRTQVDKQNATIPEATRKRLDAYKDKKMIIYSTHDSIIQKFMANLGVINVEDPYEARVKHWFKRDDDDGKFLNGLKMCNYGTAIRFETWELELEGSSNKFAYIQASIYNKDDGKFAPVEFRPIELGTICRKMFARRYNKASSLLSQYYNLDFNIDTKYQCPFNLLRNITSSFMVDDTKLNQLCQ